MKNWGGGGGLSGIYHEKPDFSEKVHGLSKCKFLKENTRKNFNESLQCVINSLKFFLLINSISKRDKFFPIKIDLFINKF
jgi:hypothetical protein